MSASKSLPQVESFAEIGDMTSEVIALPSRRLDAKKSRKSQIESRVFGRVDSLEGTLVDNIHSEPGAILQGRGAHCGRE